MFEKVQYYETVISLVTTDLGLWYLVGGGWQGAFYYEAQGAVEGSRYLFFIFQLYEVLVVMVVCRSRVGVYFYPDFNTVIVGLWEDHLLVQVLFDSSGRCGTFV